mmetsp:Transcript_37579/g.49466  ORF Transcript_37579/g.49466 Transcript_37579/m.49466 type:complete len:108 (-) Transcript_37579:1524-1847(-)|eukprot:CAMPEP_0185597096 /NCGR_PEP_ID=MMETSP0434-20130131/81154_1 /TAXON_ID=626734 ORGANISM="Favella taraikaensis, Strain Fe Narragansett Bay" /NCGR_SAMPLE_ID=MMETSP0434 /ASSEMBLY_ACC=CAM_ASM_000379 /LENGTH=107 /DNA_ID=CAMNT_0028225731 /DNA_START=194 /DNA_END=517 /DNA_ORIENTATION=+
MSATFIVSPKRNSGEHPAAGALSGSQKGAATQPSSVSQFAISPLICTSDPAAAGRNYSDEMAQSSGSYRKSRSSSSDSLARDLEDLHKMRIKRPPTAEDLDFAQMAA